MTQKRTKATKAPSAGARARRAPLAPPAGGSATPKARPADGPTAVRDWSRNRALWAEALRRQTGTDVQTWARRVRRAAVSTADQLRRWLKSRGVTGYGQQLLVMERFGYPDFVVTPAADLIDAQYKGTPHLRAVYDAVVAAACGIGPTVVQARKTYVSLVAGRRTFARLRTSTRARVDLGLRLEAPAPHPRLQPSTIHPTMAWQVALSSVADVDSHVRAWLRRAYEENS